MDQWDVRRATAAVGHAGVGHGLAPAPVRLALAASPPASKVGGDNSCSVSWERSYTGPHCRIRPHYGNRDRPVPPPPCPSPIAWMIIARTARRKSRRLLIAHSASNQTAWCAALIIASDGMATGLSAATARRRYRVGSSATVRPSALASATAMRSTMVLAAPAWRLGTSDPLPAACGRSRKRNQSAELSVAEDIISDSR